MRLADSLSKSPTTWGGQKWRGTKTNALIRGLRHLSSRFRSDEGQSLVEFALTFVVFMFLVFAVFDFGHLFFVEMSVQNALQEAARYGSTGNHLPDPNKANATLDRVTSIIDTLDSDAIGIQIPSQDVQISSAGGGSGSAGGPKDFLTVSATVHMPLFTPLIASLFPNGQYTFVSSITVQNEQFPPGETN